MMDDMNKQLGKYALQDHHYWTGYTDLDEAEQPPFNSIEEASEAFRKTWTRSKGAVIVQLVAVVTDETVIERTIEVKTMAEVE